MDDKTVKLPGNDNDKSEADMLREELESLRGTFQEQLDETTKELEHQPAIQELEYGEEMIEEEEDEEGEEEKKESKKSSSSEKKPRKKRKVGKIIAITIPVVLLLIIVGLLLAYVVASITNPNFSSFISSYVQASATETYEEKIEYLEKAASYCTDKESKMQNAMRQLVLEDIVIAMYNEKGYSEAYAYMKKNMTEDMLDNPVNKEFKEIIKISDSISEFSVMVFDKVIANVGTASEVPAMDVLSKDLVIPAVIKETAEGVLKTVAEGYIFNRSAENIGDKLTAVMSFYSSAYNALVSFGADNNTLAEKVSCSLFNNGLKFEAAAFSYLCLSPDYVAETEEYKAVKAEIAKFAEYDINVLHLAEKAFSEGKISDDELLASVNAAVNAEEDNAQILFELVKETVEALKAEEKKNFNDINKAYSAVISAHSVLGMSMDSLSLRYCEIYVTNGQFSELSSMFTSYITEEGAEKFTDAEKARYEEIKAMLASFEEIYNVFYKSISSATGTNAFDTVKAALEQAVTEDSTDYEKGFVNYFIYGAVKELAPEEDCIVYLEKAEALLPDMPLLSLPAIAQEYMEKGNYSAAIRYAEKILEEDESYQFAYYVLAFCNRAQNNIDEAVEAAKKGVEIADSTNLCAVEATVNYMLKDDFESAFNYLLMAYNSESPSIELYDLILVFAKLYEGDNAEIKEHLDNMTAVVNQTYSYNQITSYKDTVAVINGEKTLEDVFLGGNHMLSDDK